MDIVTGTIVLFGLVMVGEEGGLAMMYDVSR